MGRGAVLCGHARWGHSPTRLRRATLSHAIRKIRTGGGSSLKNQAMFDVGQFARAAKLVAAGGFVALIVDGMDLQMLALSLPGISKELSLSSVSAGALSAWTLLG